MIPSGMARPGRPGENGTDHGDVRVQVVEALAGDEGTNRIRLERDTLEALGLQEGDVVEVQARGVIWARVTLAPSEDHGLCLARLDASQQTRLGAYPGIWVSVRNVIPRHARSITLVSSRRIGEGAHAARALGEELSGRVLLKGDAIETDVVRSEQRSDGTLSVAGLRLATVQSTGEQMFREVFRVERTDPCFPARVTAGTEIRVEDGPRRTREREEERRFG